MHLLIFSNLWQLLRLIPKADLPKVEPKYQVRMIDQDELKKYRRVGVKNGSKDFSMNVGKLPKINRFGEGNAQKKASPNPVAKNQAIDFSKLNPTKNQNVAAKVAQIKNNTSSIKKKAPPKITIQDLESGNSIITDMRSRSNVENRMRQASQKNEILSELSPQSERAEIIRNTGFNIHFEPPEGVKEDELNSAEKMFYAFQKRTFVTYLNSFVKTYQQTLLKKPLLKKELKNARHLLTGKIVFDKEGHIIKIQILRSSPSDEIHHLFEETLKEIRKLPNPPADLIKDDKNFTIYYQLNINGSR
ncbi:MAG: hypothetical protein GY909_01830 [Oligoflexia bacterium]|nr:hypothetical protein [Oligoflexia bacterium]